MSKTIVSIGKISVIWKHIDIQDSLFSSNVLIVLVDESLRNVQQQQKILLSWKNTNIVNSIFKKATDNIPLRLQTSKWNWFIRVILCFYGYAGIETSAEIQHFNHNGWEKDTINHAKPVHIFEK